MKKRAHKNSNKCFKKLLRHILAICIKHYFVSYCPPNTHFPKPNPTLLQYLRKHLSVKTLIILKPTDLQSASIDWVLYDMGFHRRVFRNRLEYKFFHRNQSLLLLYLLFSTVGAHIPLILFLLTECIKRVYSKHSKNHEITQLYNIFKPRRKNIIRNLNLQQKKCKHMAQI